jgi:hypothetical protein
MSTATPRSLASAAANGLYEAINAAKDPDDLHQLVRSMWRGGRLGSRFTPRQRPRCPDRKASRDRRRMLGGSGVMPANLRHHYTEGQRAVLAIIAGEVKEHGACDLPIDKVAALAGVCRTTVQTTMHEARRLGHIEIIERPVPGRKNLPNFVTVISREWLVWLKRGPTSCGRIGSKNSILPIPTKRRSISTTSFYRAEPFKEALQARRAGQSQPGP